RERGGVIGSLDLVRERRFTLSLKRRAWGGADALDRAARERPRRRTIARVEHAKLERRAAGIHDEHCHGTDPGMRGLSTSMPASASGVAGMRGAPPVAFCPRAVPRAAPAAAFDAAEE